MNDAIEYCLFLKYEMFNGCIYSAGRRILATEGDDGHAQKYLCYMLGTRRACEHTKAYSYQCIIFEE